MSVGSFVSRDFVLVLSPENHKIRFPSGCAVLTILIPGTPPSNRIRLVGSELREAFDGPMSEVVGCGRPKRTARVGGRVASPSRDASGTAYEGISLMTVVSRFRSAA